MNFQEFIVHYFQDIQNFFIRWNVAGIVSIVDETHRSGFVYGDLGRLSTELEQADFLPVPFEDGVTGVGQTDEGQVVLFPIHGKRIRILGSDHNHFGILSDKFVIVLAQLRHVPAAEWSEKTTVEDQ